MGWSHDQLIRLAVEKKLIDRYMPGFGMWNSGDGAKVTGFAKTNSGRLFGVRIDVPENYPFSRPELFIVSPSKLIMHDGKRTINELGNSHAFHVNKNSHGDGVKICHVFIWNPSKTIVQVLLKAHLWCESYIAHLKTGRDIAYFLRTG